MEFLKKITHWLLEKEEELAKECAVPLEEVRYQIAKVELEKQKLQEKYEQDMKELDEILERLKKIEATEMLRCQAKEEK